jgi:hypothetical protein
MAMIRTTSRFPAGAQPWQIRGGGGARRLWRQPPGNRSSLLGRGGQFFSVYWNINAFGLLTQAIDGKVTARFESLYPFSLAPQQPGDVRPAWRWGPRSTLSLPGRHVLR